MNTPNTTAPSRIELPGGWYLVKATKYSYTLGHKERLASCGRVEAELSTAFAAAMTRPASPQQAATMQEMEFLGTKIMKCQTLQEVHDAKRRNMHVVTLWAALKRAFQLGQLSNMAQPPAAPSAGVREALQALVDDLNLRAEDGVVAVGQGVWVQANDALLASKS